MNYCVIAGRLGQNPEVRSTNAGKKVCNFSLATNDGWGTYKKTSWHKIVAFGDQCGPIETYLTKGSLVCVRGRIDYREYEKDGVTKYFTEIVADQVEFLDAKSAAAPVDDGTITDADFPF